MTLNVMIERDCFGTRRFRFWVARGRCVIREL